jgi:hypothetical protein
MARTQKKSQSKKMIAFNPSKGLNMSALGNVLNNIGVQITRKQEKALENKILKQTSRRSSRQTRPVLRWVNPATKTRKVATKKANNTKKNNVNMGQNNNVKNNNTKKKSRAPYKASQLKHVKHLNKYRNVGAFYNQNQISSQPRFGPNTAINNIHQAMSAQPEQVDTSSFATPASANLGVAAENIEKMKKRKVSAIPFIMAQYKKRGDHKKAELLQRIQNIYETKKNTHGFSPNTTLYEVFTKLKDAEPFNAEVDELAELFQSTGF